mgnify:FL=1
MRIPNEVMDRNRKMNEDKLDMEYLAGGFDIAENATSEKSENILSAD